MASRGAVLKELFGEKFGPEHRAGGQDDGALDSIFQLADVSGPIVIHHNLQSFRRKLQARAVILSAKLPQEVLGQLGNIFLALAQRREAQGNDVQAIEEVLAELAFHDHLAQVRIGRRQDAHIHFDGFGPAQPHEFTFLDDTQQLGLSFHAHRADLVKENCALVGDFEKPALGSDGGSERSLDVAEERALQQVNRQGAGIDRYKGAIGARAGGMNGLGHQFLAGATLTGDQHGGTTGGDLRDQVHHLMHLLALADDVGQGIALQGAAELDVFKLQARFVKRVADLQQQLVVVPRLGDIAVGAVLGGLESHLGGSVGGDHDHADLGTVALDLLEQFKPIAVGQVDVQ